MPYQWDEPDRDCQRLHIWPHQSLSPRGFTLFIGVTAALLSLPVIVFLGTVTLWFILVFVGLTLAAVWTALLRSRHDRLIQETLVIGPDTVRLTRYDHARPSRDWQAHTHWTELQIHPSKGPVPHYLTLRGGGREVEIGAFLSESERRELWPQLQARLSAARRSQA